MESLCGKTEYHRPHQYLNNLYLLSAKESNTHMCMCVICVRLSSSYIIPLFPTQILTGNLELSHFSHWFYF